MEEEEWRPIPGYEGLYEISNLGHARRIDGHRTRSGKYLRPATDGFGYYLFNLTKNNKKWTPKVHRLVAMVFLGPRPRGCVINHKDFDKSNNAVSNLEYITQKRNVEHTHTHGRAVAGERSPWAKLATEDAVFVKAHPELSRKALANMFDVHADTIRAIRSGKSWKHVS